METGNPVYVILTFLCLIEHLVLVKYWNQHDEETQTQMLAYEM